MGTLKSAHTFNMVGHCIRCGAGKRSRSLCENTDLAKAADLILSAAKAALKKS